VLRQVHLDPEMVIIGTKHLTPQYLLPLEEHRQLLFEESWHRTCEAKELVHVTREWATLSPKRPASVV